MSNDIMSKIAEISKRHEAIKLSSENVELKNLATLDKLFDDAAALMPEIKKQTGFLENFKKSLSAEEKDYEKIKPKVEKADQKERELYRKWESAKDETTVLTKDLEATSRAIKGAKDGVDTVQKRLDPLNKKAKTTQDLLAKNLTTFESSAKALGWDVSTAKYQKMLDQLKSAI